MIICVVKSKSLDTTLHIEILFKYVFNNFIVLFNYCFENVINITKNILYLTMIIHHNFVLSNLKSDIVLSRDDKSYTPTTKYLYSIRAKKYLVALK